MRITILASGDLWAGAEVVVYHLVRGLLDLPEVQLSAVFLNRGRLADEVADLGGDVHILDEAEHSFFSLARNFKKLISQLKPDILHSHRYKENFLAWYASRGSSGLRLIATQHGMPERFGRTSFKSRIRSFLSFYLLSHSFSRTVAVSEEMRETLITEYGFHATSISVIHNGIPIPESQPFSTKKPIAIGSAGRMFPVKGFELLVEIASTVIPAMGNVVFVIAGNGPQYDLLQEKIVRYGLTSSFQLPGHIDDMDKFYQDLDIYINTSVHEGIPMSVLEAMSHGLPVVVPNVGGFPEIVEEGINGYLVDNRDPSMFAARCVELLSDTEKRKQMAGSARQRVVGHFSRAAMANQYYQLYQKLLG